ncbi:hypothetical protein Tco_0174480 [Tanacetum coccineum]
MADVAAFLLFTNQIEPNAANSEEEYPVKKGWQRTAPLHMVSDMRRTRLQVLYGRKTGDARYPFKADSGIPSKVYNMEEAGPSLTEKPTNGSLRLKLVLENSDHDTMIVAPSVRDLD